MELLLASHRLPLINGSDNKVDKAFLALLAALV
jgi:hypothetical protein